MGAEAESRDYIARVHEGQSHFRASAGNGGRSHATKSVDVFALCVLRWSDRTRTRGE